MNREPDLLDRMLGHDAWTTRRLLEIAAELTDEQLDAEIDLGHRTIRRTFNHVIWNMECWTDLMKEQGVRPRPDDAASIAEMLERLDRVAKELSAFARQLADNGQLNASYLDSEDTPPRRKSFSGTLLHVATHGMHHRAQLLYMLRRAGVQDLPEGDALSWESQAGL